MVQHFNEITEKPIEEHTATLILSGLVLILGEIIPKALFRDNPNKLVLRFFPLLNFFSILLKPFIKFVEFLNKLLAKTFNLSADGTYHRISRDDLSYLISEKPIDMHEKQKKLKSGLEYIGVDRIDGPLVYVKKTHPVGYRELVECVDPEGNTRLGLVLDTSDVTS